MYKPLLNWIIAWTKDSGCITISIFFKSIENSLAASKQRQTIQFYVSDDTEKFKKIGKRIMGGFNSNVQQINL